MEGLIADKLIQVSILPSPKFYIFNTGQITEWEKRCEKKRGSCKGGGGGDFVPLVNFVGAFLFIYAP